MPSRRDVNLKEYGISEYAYREMLYFCLQYGEKKKRLEKLYIKNYEKAEIIKDDILLIERAAKEADDILDKVIIENVCYGVAPEYLSIPCGRRQFYEKRKKFFVTLYSLMEERLKTAYIS